MRAARTASPSGASKDAMTLNSSIVDRARLATEPADQLIDHYVLTRSATAAWAAINNQLVAKNGTMFWIEGPAGSGKTQFLNYLIALSERAATPSLHPGRHLSVTLEIGVEAVDPALNLAEEIFRKLDGGSDSARLWRKLIGKDALRVVLDQARRGGVQTVIAAIDFGELEVARFAADLADLKRLAGNSSMPKLIAIGAGRSTWSDNSVSSFSVVPDEKEYATVAIGCARHHEFAAQREADRGLFESTSPPAAIYPFDATAASALTQLYSDAQAIPAAARIARDALVAWRDRVPPRPPIDLDALMDLPSARSALEARLGQAGAAALKIARAAAFRIGPAHSAAPRKIVVLLAIHHLTHAARWISLRKLYDESEGPSERYRGSDLEEFSRLIAQLASLSEGTIVYDAEKRRAMFNPDAADTPQIAAFNAALPLVRRFDPGLSEVATKAQLDEGLRHLKDALAGIWESAERNRRILRQATQDFGSTFAAEREQTLAEVITMAQGGPEGLLIAASNPEASAAVARLVRSYETLAVIAAAVPRLRGMREYLSDIGLMEPADDPERSDQLARIESEGKLLMVDIAGALQVKSPSALDALESRFQRFKWTYVPYYRAAHEQWRREMERATNLAADAARYVAALAQLNTIPALGPVVGGGFGEQLDEITRTVVRCDLEGPLSPEVLPRCPRCQFVLGTASPCVAIADLSEQAHRALERKLQALSQSAITQLIRRHADGSRLDGFLKVIQAAQTDALVSVLDDQLTEYLGTLLAENTDPGVFHGAADAGAGFPPTNVGARKIAAGKPTAPSASKVHGEIKNRTGRARQN